MRREFCERPYPSRPRVVYVRPRRRPRKRRLRGRWYLLLVPLLILSAMWLAQGLEPARSWNEVMISFGVRDRERYTQLATLGVLIVAALAVWRVLQRRRSPDGRRGD